MVGAEVRKLFSFWPFAIVQWRAVEKRRKQRQTEAEQEGEWHHLHLH